MNKKNVLYVKDLNKTYSKNSSKSVHAIKNLNLEVKEGEIFLDLMVQEKVLY